MDKVLDAMCWVIAAALAINAQGCTPQELESLKDFAATLQSLKKPKKEEVTPTPTPTPIDAPICGKKNPKDGEKRGFTYKPNSDTQKWATVVLPPGAHGPCAFAGIPARDKGIIGGDDGSLPRSVHILDGWTGEKLKQEHGPIIVRCDCWSWSIPNPAVRVD